ncbi:MAG: hypothetical protein L6437_11500 [Kiritimatiellae bacterium]|nr:hypothetical protein [Verrucomicrobiota bacterium]MBU4286441.1 hypothetical protein [Verrucomicrobiota bacterium]MBU4367177.1 hypothetical protein [Verrucomicrobiota bacterium]MCG2660856.1 hypothetical protein [Kiritimatiellia bacterium]
MTTIRDLPMGAHPKALDFSHFPTRFQAVIWRNWELVSPATLARVLKTDEATIRALAADLGLRVPPRVSPRWLERGYVTIIRANWHLLPYEQLLELLGWTADRMAYVLKEEDFLWCKLGNLKPKVEPAICRALTPAERKHTRRIRDIVERHFPDLQAPDTDEPFGFLKDFESSIPVAPATPSAFPNNRKFDLRFLYSYCAVYGDPLIDPALNPYPDGLLARLAALGVNAVWLPVILYTLYPWKKFGHYSTGYEQRLESLRHLTERAARFGISVITYLNEPRCMPPEFFKEHPELQGVVAVSGENAALCTSLPEVRDLLKQGAAWLFQQVPRLGGVFTITMSENLTNCFSQGPLKSPYTNCPRCAGRKPAEAIAEVNRLIAEGVHSVKPEASVIAWDWAWREEWAHAAVDLLPKDVWLMCVSEWGLPTNVGGVKGSIVDYSISNPGPSPRSLSLWEHAHRRGLKTVAKVQVNNSWECSALPYLPVPDLVAEHLDRLAKAGVKGLMLSWTLGGYPAGNLQLLQQSADQLASASFGAAGDAIRSAWRTFSAAFREFPFSCGVAYVAPQNVGPKNLLYANPTGYTATMVGDPYDCLKGWCSIYPEDVFEQQFEKLSAGWKHGLDILRKDAPRVDEPHRAAFDDLERVATAAYCHFRSAYLQIAFVRNRAKTDAASRARVLEILDEEQQLAVTLHQIASRDSRLGFEASNHYAYTLQDLREKALNCEALRSLWTVKSA